MQRKDYNKSVDADLLTEIVATTNRSPLEFYVLPGDNSVTIGFPDDVAESVIDSIVAAHNQQIYIDKRNTRESNWQRDKDILKQWYLDPSTPLRQKALLRVIRRMYGEIVDD